MKFQNIESEIKNIMQTRIIRDAEIILNRDLEEEERMEFLNNPSQVQKLYENKLTGAAHIKLKNAVADIEERHKDIVKLEKVKHSLIYTLVHKSSPSTIFRIGCSC